MSRPTYRQTAGAVFAVVALMLSVTATAAIGWGGEDQDYGKSQKKEHGSNKDTEDYGSKDDHKGKEEYGDKEDTGKNDYGKKPPAETPPVPPTTTTPPPVTVIPPPGAETPPTVTTQTRPPSTPTTPGGPPTTTTDQGPPQTTTTPGTTPPTTTTPPLTPVAQRKRLAETGLSPWLISLFGAAFLGGGGLLFRRALVRD
jgi:LPXTG-motif cell wall-anchored protein